MNKLEKRLTLIAVVLAIVAAAIAGVSLLGAGVSTQTGTNSFIEQPVLDIIIPSLFHETSGGGINSPLNASLGQTVSLTVQLFPTTNVSVAMQFRYFLIGPLNPTSDSGAQNSSSVSKISATFNPQKLTISGAQIANVSMQLTISPNAMKGEYNAIVSAVNEQNSTQVWGIIFPINLA